MLRLDAHSVYPPDYLALLLSTALRTNADNTGGVVATLKRGDGYQAALVQALTTHKFGVGDSGFRTDAAEVRPILFRTGSSSEAYLNVWVTSTSGFSGLRITK